MWLRGCSGELLSKMISFLFSDQFLTKLLQVCVSMDRPLVMILMPDGRPINSQRLIAWHSQHVSHGGRAAA